MKDLYRILHVDPKASKEVIHAAYRALVKGKSEKTLLALNEAKDTLLDESKRKKYDGERIQDKPGKLIGNYRLIKQIAEGGFGRTYLAEHVVSGNPVCLKHALNLDSFDEEILMQEASVIWDLRHYSIPTIRDLIRLPDKSLAVIMSYIPGPTITESVKKLQDSGEKGLEPEHVAWIAERVLNALKYLHYHGVIHGDVKPHNIILQPKTHQVVIVDYGLSMLRPKKGEQNKGSTPLFAAPEVVTGGPLTPESDLYGLGMTMAYALGGDLDRKRLPGHTPPELAEFIKSLVRIDVRQRPRWDKTDICEEIKRVRQKDFGRTASGMKPLPE